MTWKNQKILAVIPARGGSKGIPKKNLSVINGLSLIAHVGRVVADLPWIDFSILSTDSTEIAEEGVRSGLQLPFMRPANLATDEATSLEVWRHAWLECEILHGTRYDLSILLEPTSPMRKSEDIEATVDALIQSGLDAAATVSRTPAHFSPEKTLIVDARGLINFYLPHGAKHSRRQTIPPYYHRNGICYAVTRKSLINDGNIIQNSCAAVIIDRPVVNIDEPIDLEWADFLMNKAKS